MSSPSDDYTAIEYVLCDLDGVVWLAHEAIPGAPEAIARLRASGRRVLFVTNNSASVMREHEDALAAIGIDASGDVVSSAQAAASLVHAGERVLVCGGPGVIEAVSARGAVTVPMDSQVAVDVAVVGLDRAFDFAKLATTSAAIRDGARFVATNTDATFPTPAGLTPGGGSIVAAVATAAGTDPVVAGKPHRPMADLVRAVCGEGFSERTAIMVGDRWATDGAFARELGCPFALVRSGVTADGDDPGGAVDVDVADLAEITDLVAGAGRPDSTSR